MLVLVLVSVLVVLGLHRPRYGTASSLGTLRQEAVVQLLAQEVMLCGSGGEGRGEGGQRSSKQ